MYNMAPILSILCIEEQPWVSCGKGKLSTNDCHSIERLKITCISLSHILCFLSFTKYEL